MVARFKLTWIFLWIFLASSCGTLRSPYYSKSDIKWSEKRLPEEKPIFSFYLIGDAGAIDDSKNNSVVEAVVNVLQRENSDLISACFLGDNIYPAGLPSLDDPDRKKGEEILDAQLELSNHLNGELYFVPGNHDWNDAKQGGLSSVLRQEKYVENWDNVKFEPSGGCADPYVKKVNNDLTLIFLDSQWWLHEWDMEEGINKNCKISHRTEFIDSVKEIFADNEEQNLLVMMHHPIRSNGRHGGHYGLVHHIFPLYDLKIWIPLPIVGSVIIAVSKKWASRQEISHSLNTELMDNLVDIAQSHPRNVTFATGHEHGLQYFSEDNVNYIVSGGGCKKSYVAKGNGAKYAREALGFVRLVTYDSGECWAEFYTVSKKETNIEYRALLYD